MLDAVRVQGADDLTQLAEVIDSQWGTRPSTGLEFRESLIRFGNDGTLGAWAVSSDSEILSYGVGFLASRLPARWNPSGIVGYVQSMVTRPDMRRRGYASAVLREMLAWMDAHDARVVQLVASAEGEPLYSLHGFVRDPFGTPMVQNPDRCR